MGILFGALISVLDILIIGRFIPPIRDLAFLPQLADHVVFGAVVGAVVRFRTSDTLPQRGAVPTDSESESVADDVRDVAETTCCVVGGGPAGVVLALLLARRGVDVVLLEAHDNFDREFRGDTLHPAILEIMDQIGLAERLHELPHVKVHGPVIPAAGGAFRPFDLRSLKTKFPYIMFMHQPIFLECLADEAKKYPSFRLVMGANVRQLVEEDGIVRGVRYRSDDGWHEVRAVLTIGARRAVLAPATSGPH